MFILLNSTLSVVSNPAFVLLLLFSTWAAACWHQSCRSTWRFPDCEYCCIPTFKMRRAVVDFYPDVSMSGFIRPKTNCFGLAKQNSSTWFPLQRNSLKGYEWHWQLRNAVRNSSGQHRNGIPFSVAYSLFKCFWKGKWLSYRNTLFWHERKEVKAIDIFDPGRHFAEDSHGNNWLQNELCPTWDNSVSSVFQSFAFRFSSWVRCLSVKALMYFKY